MAQARTSKELSVTTDSRARIGIAALIVGVVIGVLLGFVLDDESGESSPQGRIPGPAGPGPSTEENGVPVGYARTEEGAVAAATNFNLLAGKDDLLDLDAMTTAMRTLAAPSWKDEASRQAESGYEYIVNTYGEDADVSAAVVRYDLADFTPERASVRLWTVSLASGSKRPTVEEVWAIVTIELVWIDDDWRVEEIESAVGPAPIDLPSGQPEQNATTLMEEFDEFEGAPVP
jgi:hypothetical protein